MRNWNDYKATFGNPNNLFSLARSSDAEATGAFLDQNPGSDLNRKNHKGHSPLMLSVYNGNHAVSELLLSRGADPNSSDFSGNTVLMGAAFKGDVEAIQLLIRHGARKDVKNHTGMTAEQWASAFGRRQVLALLQPKANHSRFQSLMNFTKILWGLMRSHFRKEATA